ncbi:ATP-grasp domain-containing protein [Chitinimonas viridis]|uniref:ATP-grasp domain-containing protein n=1 Tax=Chitinimonas viridis TaxID=664880 RepID=A0ABT8B330_9NEIS|nr:ATP-grasp domain-containing protein [Chitinimonas viridis]MDN3576667.1 ATP-grasp domain-containing protein [Chitinimonas viridis]
MNILVLQSVRYDLICYDRAIDHHRHQVVYIGTAEKHAQIPAGLPCEKIEREGRRPLYEEVSEILERLDRQFDFLIAISEHELVDAARLRERFGIPGPMPLQARKVRDKTLMKQCIIDAGIRAPRYAALDHWLAGQQLAVADDASIILKPVDGASSVDVRRFDSQQTLADALKAGRTGVAALDDGTGDTARYQVEEFIEGRVVHIDGIARQGTIQILVASRYVGTLMGFAHGKPAGSIQFDTTDEMQQWVSRILQAVEIRDGAFHLEIIEGQDGPVFLEIAHRVGGARITEAFERKTGIHLAIADIGTIVDPDYTLQPNWDSSAYYGWFIVPAHQLNKPYCRVSGYDALLASGTVETLNVLGTDKPVPKKISYAETLLPLAGLVRANSSQVLQDTLDTLFNELVLEGLDESAAA